MTQRKSFDVFLSYHRADKSTVELLAGALRSHGFSVFLDEWELIPGEPWQEALEEALEDSRTCAVFLGPQGFGPWENEELRVALDRRSRDRGFRVIPVLLPKAKLKNRRLPAFLARLTWVVFKDVDDDRALAKLVSGIMGVPANSSASAAQLVGGRGGHLPTHARNAVGRRERIKRRIVTLGALAAGVALLALALVGRTPNLEKAAASVEAVRRQDVLVVAALPGAVILRPTAGRIQARLSAPPLSPMYRQLRARCRDVSEAVRYGQRHNATAVICYEARTQIAVDVATFPREASRDLSQIGDVLDSGLDLVSRPAATFRFEIPLSPSETIGDCIGLQLRTEVAAAAANLPVALAGLSKATRCMAEAGESIGGRERAPFLAAYLVASFENDPRQAIRHLGNAITIRRFPEAYNNRGLAYLAVGNLREAIADFTEAVELRADFAEAYNNRGNAFKRARRIDEAMADFNRALEVRPRDATVVANRGLLYYAVHDLVAALKELAEAVRLSPRSIVLRNVHGLLLREAGQLVAAEREFSTGIEIEQSSALYNNRGLVFLDLGLYESARRDFDRALELSPNDPQVLNNRGISWTDSGDHGRAIADLRRALDIVPDYSAAKYNLAVAYDESGDKGSAEEHLRSLLGETPEFLKAHSMLVDLLRDSGRHEEAVMVARAALDLPALRAPKIADAYFVRGSLNTALGRRAEALRDFDGCIRLGPGLLIAYLRRVDIFIEQRDYRAAIEELERVEQAKIGSGRREYEERRSFVLKRLAETGVKPARTR